MDYFLMGLISFQAIFLVILLWMMKFFVRQKSLIRYILNVHSTKMFNRIEETATEIFDEIESLRFDILDIQSDIYCLHQQQISWINPTKTLPKSSEMLWLLIGKDERKGFFNQKNLSWTTVSEEEGNKILSFEEVSQWKPLLQK